MGVVRPYAIQNNTVSVNRACADVHNHIYPAAMRALPTMHKACMSWTALAHMPYSSKFITWHWGGKEWGLAWLPCLLHLHIPSVTGQGVGSIEWLLVQPLTCGGRYVYVLLPNCQLASSDSLWAMYSFVYHRGETTTTCSQDSHLHSPATHAPAAKVYSQPVLQPTNYTSTATPHFHDRCTQQSATPY